MVPCRVVVMEKRRWKHSKSLSPPLFLRDHMQWSQEEEERALEKAIKNSLVRVPPELQGNFLKKDWKLWNHYSFGCVLFLILQSPHLPIFCINYVSCCLHPLLACNLPSHSNVSSVYNWHDLLCSLLFSVGCIFLTVIIEYTEHYYYMNLLCAFNCIIVFCLVNVTILHLDHRKVSRLKTRFKKKLWPSFSNSYCFSNSLLYFYHCGNQALVKFIFW